MPDSSVSIKVVNSISELNRDEWDRCAVYHSNDGLDKIEDPFTSYDFLNALEKSRSVGENTGWLPYHLAAIKKNKLVGAAPLYVKSNSQGEYILTTIGRMLLSVLAVVTIQSFKFQFHSHRSLDAGF